MHARSSKTVASCGSKNGARCMTKSKKVWLVSLRQEFRRLVNVDSETAH